MKRNNKENDEEYEKDCEDEEYEKRCEEEEKLRDIGHPYSLIEYMKKIIQLPMKRLKELEKEEYEKRCKDEAYENYEEEEKLRDKEQYKHTEESLQETVDNMANEFSEKNIKNITF